MTDLNVTDLPADPELPADLGPESNGDDADAQRPAETPEAYFRRVATRRVNFALDHLRHLENTADKRLGYAYTTDQAQVLIATLQAQVDRLRVLFSTSEQLRVQL